MVDYSYRLSAQSAINTHVVKSCVYKASRLNDGRKLSIFFFFSFPFLGQSGSSLDKLICSKDDLDQLWKTPRLKPMEWLQTAARMTSIINKN